jgi:hypothetical protein
MPNLETDAIQTLVDEDKIIAITLDTNVFDQFKCNLEYRSLTALKQFKDTNVPFLLSEVIIGEVRSHISRDAADVAEKARAGINQFLKAWRIDRDRAEIAKDLGIDQDADAHAEKLMTAYVEQMGAEIIPVEPGVSVQDLNDRYFAGDPPFSGRKGKKNEFPDAIALLSLEAWAEEKGGFVIAVSKDGDWIDYAEQSKNIITVKELTAGLDLFNRESSVVAAKIVAKIRDQTTPALFGQIKSGLESLIEDFEIVANASTFYEEEIDSSKVINWQISDTTNFAVVASDADSVSLAFNVELEAEFVAYFSMSAWDGIDREYVPLGSTRASVTEKSIIPIIATMPKEEDDNPEPIEVEIETTGLTIDFDYVEPDWND